MRAYLYLILFLLALVLPFVMRLAIVGQEPAHKAAGVERLTIITPHNPDIRREFQRAFSDWHVKRYGAPVQIDYLVPGGAVDVKRQLEKTYEGFRDRRTRQLPADVPMDIDLVWGGGDFFFDVELKPLGILQPMHLDPQMLRGTFPEDSLAGVRLYDATRDAQGRPTPQWVGVCLSGFGIAYNSDLYQVLGLPAPQAWHDLALPQLNGLVALADPAHSGSAAMAFMMVIQRAMADEEARFYQQNPALKGSPSAALQRVPAYKAALAAGYSKGMADLLLIAANARYFTDQAMQVPNDVGNGQAAAGMCIDFYGRIYQESVGPRRCNVVLPAGATAITPDPVGILYGVKGRQLELALHFIEFLLSPKGQLLWILEPGPPNGPAERSLRRSPVRRDVYADQRGWADDVNPFTQAGGFNQRAEWTRTLFSDTRLLWAAAWIDTRDTLKKTYGRVLRIGDPSRRAALLSELANLPVTMSDVEAMREERRQSEKAGNAEEWKARKRIEWDNRFREHYLSILRKAAS